MPKPSWTWLWRKFGLRVAGVRQPWGYVPRNAMTFNNGEPITFGDGSFLELNA